MKRIRIIIGVRNIYRDFVRIMINILVNHCWKNTHRIFFISCRHKALSVFLLFWGIFTGFVFVGTLIHGHVTLKLIFLTLALTFLFLSIGEFAKSHVVTTIGELRNWSLLWSSCCIYRMCRNYWYWTRLLFYANLRKLVWFQFLKKLFVGLPICFLFLQNKNIWFFFI